MDTLYGEIQVNLRLWHKTLKSFEKRSAFIIPSITSGKQSAKCFVNPVNIRWTVTATSYWFPDRPDMSEFRDIFDKW